MHLVNIPKNAINPEQEKWFRYSIRTLYKKAVKFKISLIRTNL